ncbi:MAG: hypothetical protein ACO4CW_00405, partial [Planctomycetota bacterium]
KKNFVIYSDSEQIGVMKKAPPVEAVGARVRVPRSLQGGRGLAPPITRPAGPARARTERASAAWPT